LIITVQAPEEHVQDGIAAADAIGRTLAPFDASD
jgi:hypothetical protein